MKKFMLLGALLAGGVLWAMADTAEAGHRRCRPYGYRSSYYSSPGYGRSYRYRSRYYRGYSPYYGRSYYGSRYYRGYPYYRGGSGFRLYIGRGGYGYRGW